MKKYNIQGYIRDKNDLEQALERLPDYGTEYHLYTRDELITRFLPLVENLARKFSTSQQASGVLDIRDLIQDGRIGLTKAVDRIDWERMNESEDKEQTMKSFLSKRIRGAIRRSIDIHRGDIRIPEHKLNEIRKDFDNEKNSSIFFNSIFDSIDDQLEDENSYLYQVEDTSEDPMRKEKLHGIIRDIMLKHLTDKEYHVIRLSYGLGCDKMSAKQIATKLDMKGASSYVRVSQLKKQAIEKLKQVIGHSQVADYL